MWVAKRSGQWILAIKECAEILWPAFPPPPPTSTRDVFNMSWWRVQIWFSIMRKITWVLKIYFLKIQREEQQKSIQWNHHINQTRFLSYLRHNNKKQQSSNLECVQFTEAWGAILKGRNNNRMQDLSDGHSVWNKKKKWQLQLNTSLSQQVDLPKCSLAISGCVMEHNAESIYLAV